MIDHAVVIAAGVGSRMGELGQRAHKITMKYCGVPLANRLLDVLAAGGIRRVTVVSGYRQDDVITAVTLAAHHHPSLELEFAHDDSISGTLNTLAQAKAMIREPGFLHVDANIVLSAATVNELCRYSGIRPTIAIGLTADIALAPTHSLVAVETQTKRVTEIDDTRSLTVDTSRIVGCFMGISRLPADFFQPTFDSAIEVHHQIRSLLQEGHAVEAVWERGGRYRHFAYPTDFDSEYQ
jgi:choline kinase